MASEAELTHHDLGDWGRVTTSKQTPFLTKEPGAGTEASSVAVVRGAETLIRKCL